MIVGLGNPGKKYTETRHNIGFMCIDYLAEIYGIPIDTSKFKTFFGTGRLFGHPVVLVKPQTYMNLSGGAVRGLADFYKVPLERIIVIFDDMDIPLGTLRIRPKGGASGHNGMRSITQHLGTQEFPRIRFGVDRPPGKMDPAAFVLLPFKKEDHLLVQETIQRVDKAVAHWLTEGIDIAMTRQNGTVEQAAATTPAPRSILEEE